MTLILGAQQAESGSNWGKREFGSGYRRSIFYGHQHDGGFEAIIEDRDKTPDEATS
jgi:hypothetical protein